MPDPDPIEALAVGLNADSKVSRKRALKNRPVHDPLGVGAEPGQIMTADGLQDPPAEEPDGEAAITPAPIGPGDAQEDELEEVDRDDGDEGTRAMVLAVERFVRIAEQSDFESGTLIGDVRNTLLDLFKAQPRPWTQIGETDQKNIVAGLEQVATVMIRKIVLVVMADDTAGGSVQATLESYAEKGGITIKLVAEGDRDTVIALHDAVGGPVILKRVAMNGYHGERREPGIMPDQPGLFEGEVERAASAGAYQGDDDGPDPFFDADNEEAIAKAKGEEPNPDADLNPD